MTRQELEAFRKAYEGSVKRCIKGKDKNGKEIDEQSDWVFFDRATIQRLLDLTDRRTGGIRIYFGQYEKANIDIISDGRKDKEEYIGRLSVALAAANKTKNGYIDIDEPQPETKSKVATQMFMSTSSGGGGTENMGTLCPPECAP